jgi:hypothetical protein
MDNLNRPAMTITILAPWLVASDVETKRKIGFWVFLLSNAVWIEWGIFDAAWALVSLQVGLAAMNIRGSIKASHKANQEASTSR